jgi:plastocyanin
MTLHAARPAKARRLVILILGTCLAGAASAEEPAQIAVSLKDHRFDPAEIHIPAGKPAILVVTNHDSTAEEFDSSALKVEKIVAAGHYATIHLRPLSPGRYPFVGEFNPATASGIVVAE